MKLSRSCLRPLASCSLLLAFIAAASQAASLDALLDPPHHDADRATDDATSVLSLDEAVRLSLNDQPILSGHEAVINANERQAVSAAQLPDPKLSGGLKELPVDTSEAFSLRRDNFTEFTVGLSQDLPRADKREFRVLTPEEAQRFASCCPEDPAGLVLLVALTTGLRPSEYLAIRAEDFDRPRPGGATPPARGRAGSMLSEPCNQRARPARA